MIYNEKGDIKKAIKAAAVMRGITFTEIAARLDLTPQELNDRFNRKQVSFDNMRDICAAMGCCMDIYIIPRDAGKN